MDVTATHTLTYSNGAESQIEVSGSVEAVTLILQSLSNGNPEPEPASDPEPYTLSFMYDGLLRVVENPKIIRGAYHFRDRGYNALLSGFEVSRGGIPSDPVYKNYSLKNITAP